MLRGFFGTKQSILPPPPKNQIEVACPACGAAQYEPRLVVSTFCKSCGVHLTIHKKKVTASAVTRSGAVGVDDLWENATPTRRASSVKPEPAAPAPEPTPAVEPEPELPAAAVADIRQESAPAESPPDAPPPQAEAAPLITPAIDEAAEAAQAGFGAFLQAVSKQPTAPSSGALDSKLEHPHLPRILASATPSAATPLTPSTPVAPPNSTLEKMKSQSVYRQQYFKDIECFECGHKLKVSRSSKITDCVQCGALICLEDLDINLHHTEPIRTRGDVIVRKPGLITTSKIECKDLRCLGTIEAEIDCQGEATFRTEGTITGPISCRKLTIEKGADVIFTHTVKAGDMFINARVTGNLNASGKITIGLYGAVNGDVTARSVAIEPGGELNGAMNIIRVPSTPSAPPPPTED